MADFLGALGAVPQPALAKEQLRQLEACTAMPRPARSTGSISGGGLRKLSMLIRTFRKPLICCPAALEEFENANHGVLPVSANDALSSLITFMETATHYREWRGTVLAQLKHPIHTQQKYWLIQRINDLYLRALQNRGRGIDRRRRDALYGAGPQDIRRPGRARSKPSLRFIERNHAPLSHGPRCLRSLALPPISRSSHLAASAPIIKEQIVNHEQVIRDVADTVHDLLGPRDAIAFMLDRIEDPPDWLRFTSQRNDWIQNSNKLGEWRTEVKDLGDLDRVFSSPSWPSYAGTSVPGGASVSFMTAGITIIGRRKRRTSPRWPRKSWPNGSNPAFGRISSPNTVLRLAGRRTGHRYSPQGSRSKNPLRSGPMATRRLSAPAEAFAESIAILLPLVELRPNNLAYRTKLMHAYFRTGKQAELLAMLKQTDAFFHEKDRWNEGPLAGLAASCLENNLYTQSVGYYQELIPLHQRTHPRRGVGNGTLSGYYAGAAQAYSGLGKTKEAVDMASGAVVSWAPGQQQRHDALESLVKVLAAAPDLAAYVADLGKQKLQIRRCPQGNWAGLHPQKRSRSGHPAIAACRRIAAR